MFTKDNHQDNISGQFPEWPQSAGKWSCMAIKEGHEIVISQSWPSKENHIYGNGKLYTACPMKYTHSCCCCCRCALFYCGYIIRSEWIHIIYSPIFFRLLHRQWNNRPISQIPQCIKQISHNAPFCNRNVHTRAHFCYKMVHYGIRHRCIMGFGLLCYYNLLSVSEVILRDMGKISPPKVNWYLSKIRTKTQSACIFLWIYCNIHTSIFIYMM